MKKLLSIMLVGLMVASVFAVPASAFLPAREVTSMPETVYVNQDYSDDSKTDFTSGYGEPGVPNDAEIIGGKAVYTPNPMNNVMTLVSDATVDSTAFTVEFDVSTNKDLSVVEGGGLSFYFASQKDSYAMECWPAPLTAGTTRTYKFTLDKNAGSNLEAQTTLSYKDEGASSFTSVNHAAATGYYPKTQPNGHYRTYAGRGTSGIFISDTQLTLGARVFNSKPSFDGEIAITLDNIKIYRPASNVVGSNYESEGLLYTNDFETGIGFATSNLATTEKGTENNGNTYYTLSGAQVTGPNDRVDVADASNPALTSNSVITIDARCNYEYAPFFIFGRDNTISNGRGFGIGLLAPKDGKWYTFRIEVGNYKEIDGTTYETQAGIDSVFTVYRKERGAADSTYARLSGKYLGGIAEQHDPDNYDYGYITTTGYYSSAARFGLGFMGYKTSNTEKEKLNSWSFDNLQIRKNIAYSGTWANGAADITFDSNDTAKTAILASYNTGDVLKEVEFVDLTGKTVDIDLSVAEGTAASKLYVWSSLVGGKPILETPITID